MWKRVQIVLFGKTNQTFYKTVKNYWLVFEIKTDLEIKTDQVCSS